MYNNLSLLSTKHLQFLLFKSTIVSKALSCIENHLESVNDTYATALISYTLALAKHNETLSMLTLLRRKAIKNGESLKKFVYLDTRIQKL